MAECLLQFLDSLTEPVVPYPMYTRALATETKEEVYQVVNALPELVSGFLVVILRCSGD